MTKIKALGLCGSLRADSYNLKLLKLFLARLDASGAFETTFFGPLDLPLVNQDLETKPLDQRVLNLHAALDQAQVVVVASPEYNGSIGGVLKNAVDWATRPKTNHWDGKVMALLAASPGALGGARGLIHVRTILSGLKAWIIPEQVQLPGAHEAFEANGALKSELARKQIEIAAQALETLAKKLLG